MKLDMKVVLLEMNGDMMVQATMKDGVKTGEEYITLGLIFKAALLNLNEDEQKMSGVKRHERYTIATKITKAENDDEDADLTVEEVATIKKTIGKKYQPIIVGQIWNILEGKEA